jgi:PAS domain S-box-containing protein
MKPALRVIIIEDSPNDALLMVRELERAGYTVKMQRVETAEALRDALAQGTWDLVLADYSLPKFSATEGLAILWQTGLDVPFIIVSGCIGEEATVQLMRDGAADCVMKDHLSLLGPHVQRELYDADERKRKRDVEGSLADSEKRYRLLVESQTDLIVKTDPEGRILYANPTYLALFGKSSLELMSLSYQPLIHPDDLPSVELTVADLFHPSHVCRYEERAMTVDGWRWIEWNTRAELDSKGTVVALAGSGRDITERKQVEYDLHTSEADLRQAQTVARVGSWRWDITHDKLVWSDEMYRIFGIAPQEFTGSLQDVIARAIHPDDRRNVEESNRSVIEDHKPRPIEYRIVWPDHSVHTVWAEAGEMTLDEHGNTALLTGVVLDITDRKQAEERIQSLLDNVRAEKAMQDRLLSNMADEVWFADTTGQFTLANPSACKAFSIENAGNLDIQQFARSLEVLRPDGSPRPVEEAPPLRALAGETVIAQEEIVRLPLSGELRYRQVNSSPVRDAQGTIIGCVSVVRDITDRKQAEEALRNSELRYRTFIDATSDLVFLKDESFRYIMTNKANNAFLGRSETEVIGSTDLDLLPNEAAMACRASDQEALAKGMRVATEETVGSKTYQSIKFPIPLADGHVGVGGYIRDITEFKRAEAEKEGLREQLVQSEKLEAIGQLAGGVAHDFNNLLTGILGNVAIIRRDLPASDPLVANLLAVETAARQAADLTKGLLTFSHKGAVTAVPLNMAETVDTTLSILKHSLPATMKIVLDMEQPSWNVLADLSQITQVILNLAVNARDAMQGKGTLTIRLRNEEVGQEYVRGRSFARTGEFVHLSVADTGPGIPPEIREHLFEPFYTTKPTGSGTGLGLSSVYGAVTQADGWVTADSPGGGGAIFDIFLPRCLDKPSTHTTPSDIPANVCSGTVLVAEDEPVVRAVAQALLTRSGCSILTAEDGASALRTLREHQGTIDLILLDMTMPGMTTQEIVPALRALSPSVPILLTSGYVSGEEVRRFLEEGTAQGFLPKPYEVHELLDSVRHLLERS